MSSIAVRSFIGRPLGRGPRLEGRRHARRPDQERPDEHAADRRDYSQIHGIDSPANRLIRRDVWLPGDDLGQQSFATVRYFDDLAARVGMDVESDVLDVGSGTGGLRDPHGPDQRLPHDRGRDHRGRRGGRAGPPGGTGLEDRVAFVQGAACPCPSTTPAFDIAISMNVMNVFEDKVAHSGRRAAAPGGTWAFLSGTFEFDQGDADIRRRMLARIRDPPVHRFARVVQGEAHRGRVRASTRSSSTSSDFRVQMDRWRTAWTRGTATPSRTSRATSRPTTTSSTSPATSR